MDLLKTFFCPPQQLLIVKFHAYGFDMKSLNFIYDHQVNKKQRVNVGGAYSSRRELWSILYGARQGSILGQFLFNIFDFTLFYFLESTHVALHHSSVTKFLCGCSTTKD